LQALRSLRGGKNNRDSELSGNLCLTRSAMVGRHRVAVKDETSSQLDELDEMGTPRRGIRGEGFRSDRAQPVQYASMRRRFHEQAGLEHNRCAPAVDNCCATYFTRRSAWASAHACALLRLVLGIACSAIEYIAHAPALPRIGSRPI